MSYILEFEYVSGWNGSVKIYLHLLNGALRTANGTRNYTTTSGSNLASAITDMLNGKPVLFSHPTALSFDLAKDEYDLINILLDLSESKRYAIISKFVEKKIDIDYLKKLAIADALCLELI